MLKRSTFAVLLIFLLPTFGTAQLILISRNQEIEIGREVAKEIEREYGLWDDPEQTRRVERIGRSLVAVCDRKDMPYTFKILDEEKELNAITAPGGFIYITKALLKALESDDEVAFVLGHEVGHVSGDHIRKQISQAMAGSLLLDILTGGSGRLIQLGSDIMFTLYQRGYSRNHERDADTRGVRYMKAAGYNPVASITALKKLGMERYKGINKWFATHPDVPSRVQRLATMLGVDPETLQPLPKSGTAELEGMPCRSAYLFFVANGSVYRLDTDTETPQLVWQLKGRSVEQIQVPSDGKTVWLLVRDGDSEFVHLARLQDGRRKTNFVASLYAHTVRDFQRSPDGRWLAVLAEYEGRPFMKVFDSDGKEIALPDRTPIGKPLAISWLPDNRLLILTERFGTMTLVALSPGGTSQLVSADRLRQPAQLTAIDDRTMLVLTDGTLHQSQWDNERVTLQPIVDSVYAFAVKGKLLAVVKDGKLQVGKRDGGKWQGETLDDRSGHFADLALSSDGQWLAYTYRAKLSDTPQLWLAHLPSKRLWRIAVNAKAPVFSDRP